MCAIYKYNFRHNLCVVLLSRFYNLGCECGDVELHLCVVLES
jgi:hypothetical protein